LYNTVAVVIKSIAEQPNRKIRREKGRDKFFMPIIL